MVPIKKRHPPRSVKWICVLVLILLGVVPAVLALADCPSGCSCMLPADAKKMGYDPCSGTQQICGYDNTQQLMYCYAKPTTTTVPAACPSECECLSDAAAKEKYGAYTKCSDTVCGYEPTAAAMIPRYCVKKAPTVTLTFQTVTMVTVPTCPTGCECLPESQALQQPNVYVRCSDTPCSQAVTGSAIVKSYCYKKAQTSVCPSGCDCLSDEDAKQKGYSYCNGQQTVCGYQSITGATSANSYQKALYCYGKPVSTCPSGCDCISEATAKEKYGNYKKCSEYVCGYEQSAAAQVPEYCIAQGVPAVPVAPSTVCPEGCTCLSKEEGIKYGYPVCRGVTTICGYDNTQMPLYCFEKVPNTLCYYDYQKNTCTGTCGQAYNCSIVYSTKDQSGKVVSAVCDCVPPPSAGCAYDQSVNTCTGTCANGGTCVQVGLSQTGAAPVPVCSCEVTKCYFDYAKDACVGSCSDPAEICQLNTIYRDATTGKTTYAQCHCKAKGGEPAVTGVIPVPVIPATSPGVPCSCDVNTGSCTGTCPAPQSCVITKWAPGADKMCTACECMDVCRLDAQGQCAGTCPNNGACTLVTKVDMATGKELRSCNCEAGAVPTQPAPAPDVFTSIGNFFRSLFGMK